MSIVNDILNRYLGGNASAGSTADDFHAVTQNAPTDVISKGLQAALNSSETPAAGQMIGQMFEQSSPEQRAAMLNQLIAALGPSAQGVLGGILGSSLGGAVAPNVDAGQAANVSTQQVEEAVTQAQQHSPAILGGLSDFCAQHPTLVKTLGSAALAIALGKISQHMRA